MLIARAPADLPTLIAVMGGLIFILMRTASEMYDERDDVVAGVGHPPKRHFFGLTGKEIGFIGASFAYVSLLAINLINVAIVNWGYL